jgi:D-xylose transport system substrate-binding protein
MAIGVVAALADQGLDGVVPVSGQDGDAANLNNVARGLQLVDVWKDAFGLGQTAGHVAVQLCNGVAFEDITAPDDLGDHVAPAAGTAAQPFDTENEDGEAVTVQSITLKPTPVTQENLNLPIDLGWIEKDVACDGAEADVAACQ